MPAQEVDGHDFFAVYDAAGTAIARAAPARDRV